MIDQVSLDMTPNRPTVISGTSVRPSADMLCSVQEFKEGSSGTCVERIQRAIGMSESSIDGIFGPITKRAVTTFQNANIQAYRDNPRFEGDYWRNVLELGVVGSVA